ncbi:FixH family protein [Caldilinea sp.]
MLASVWLMIAVSVTPAAAHGGGTPQVVDAPAGPYRLFAWTTPDPWRAGEVAHITVAVTRVDAAGQVFPVADAQVMIRLTSETQPEQTLTLPAQPVSAVATGFYELDHKFPGDGLWRIEVEARGAEGVGVVAFTMAVEPAASAPWLLWAGATLAAVVIAFGLWQAARRRATQAVARRTAQPSLPIKG